ncbi:unnamed protein product [Phytophthora fragariaefolia]|uniref:Unnamed protein product n=1 Tax=Phytophthora fragariaefolia TaxID=1490495 RepID=A0A9W6U507_9STRA|nr:unnamed protein product [Phytophthora fragariaefolia]
MELCEGGTLEEFITMRNREEGLPENYAWIILKDVASGLKVLHDHDIVHLDVKPDNIFITEDGRLKIGDFGMAGKVMPTSNTSSQFSELEGDAKYMAKELLSSADRLPSADIFCLAKASGAFQGAQHEPIVTQQPADAAQKPSSIVAQVVRSKRGKMPFRKRPPASSHHFNSPTAAHCTISRTGPNSPPYP